MRRRVWRGMLVFVSLVVSTPVVAQVLYGSIVGTVTDSADLAVPGATVTITHAETNQARETTTNESGNYAFPNVAAGTYRVDVALPGFQSFRAQDIAVRLNVNLPDLEDQAVGVELARAAHERCPYSRATRGNIEVSITANGTAIA